jgi:glutathione S-transferase
VFTAVRYGAADARLAEEARTKILAALDRLEQELGDGEYLVARRFTVADLTAASLLYPLVLPPEAPRAVDDLPDPYEQFRASLRKRRGYRWTEEIFARHRHDHPAAGEAPTSVDPGRVVPAS